MPPLARWSALALVGLLSLANRPQSLVEGGEEENCIHLLGYSGAQSGGAPQQKRTLRPAAGVPGGVLEAGICVVDNARANRSTPLKTNADFVPITGDDSLGFYCVYGVKASPTGGIGGNVCIYLFELSGGEILMFGSGYGNIPGANLFDAAYDMERVDQVIRFCMGKDPATTPLRIVAPHGHGDHINPACNRELERLGYRILEIAFHQGDFVAINNMAWTAADRALFRVIPPSTSCLQEQLSFTSPLGKIWFFDRPGHTPGSIDLVIDVRNDATNRFVVRGSQPSPPCLPVPGQREVISAHGNVELISTPPTLSDVTPLVGSALGGTPITVTGANFLASGAGQHVVLLNGVPASNVTVVNNTTLTCVTPSGPAGQLVEVAVVNNNGKAVYSGTFFYNALPTLTSITPTSGDWHGATLVQVRGSGFLSGTNSVTFGGVPGTSISVKGDSLLTVRTPAGTPGASVDVTLNNPNGSATLSAGFFFNPDVAISSVAPPSSSSLGGSSIVLTGFGFTGNGATPSVTFGGIPATSVTLVSDTSVTCVAPAGTPGSVVDVVLSNSTGSDVLTGFRYHALPTIASISPPAGRSTGGTQVTIAGAGFQVDSAGTNLVRFGGIPAVAVTVLSDGSLTCKTPAGSAGTVANVTVTNQNGTATLPLAFGFTPPLAMDALLPASGTSLGGTLVKLSGSGFLDGPAGPTTVTFGGVAATEVNVPDDATLECRTPPGVPLSTVDVVVSNANGSLTATSAFRYHGLPTLSTVSPAHGHASAFTPVTLTGTGFLNDDAGFSLVVVGGIAASQVEVVDDHTITCLVPPGTAGASVDVLLANQNGNANLPGGFRYHALPTLTSLSPADGPAGSRPRITLNGSGFLNDLAGTPSVTFGGVAATGITVSSDLLLRCDAPTGTPGQSVDVRVSNARGQATLTKGYRYHARPVLTAASPNRGTFQGGTQVTLTGTGFSVDGAGSNTVSFGGLAASGVVVVDDGTLRCITPAGTRDASVDVTLTNTNGSITLVKGFSYSVPPPAVLSLSPASGPAANPGSVQLTGSGFVADAAGTNTVRFGTSTAGNVVVTSDTALTSSVPPGSPGTRVDVAVSNTNGTGTLVQGFRYHALPTLTALTPPSGSALGGATLQLTGSGFQVDSPGANVVTFDGVAASDVLVLDDHTITCRAPAGTPGASATVTLSNANGAAATLPFRFHALPSLTLAAPNLGPASGSQTVTLTGSGFLADAAGNTSIRFGNRLAGSVTVLDDTTLTCTTPRNLPGLVDITVTNDNGSATLANGYHYGKPPPEITSITPADGRASGGTKVTLKGRGFQTNGAGISRVKFADAFSENVITLDDETILCTVPAGTAGAVVDVGLNNNAGTVIVSAGYRYHPLPTLTSITPGSGDTLAKTPVILSGSGFMADQPGITTVLFGAIPANKVEILDDSTIRCRAFGPPGALLDVTVRNGNGTAVLPQAYRITGGTPRILGVSPSSGPFTGGTEVTITGTGFSSTPTRVAFGNGPGLSTVVVSDTTLTCVTPPGEIDQSVSITVRTENGACALVAGFTYGSIRPELTKLTPASGPASGGTRVSLTGGGFLAPGAGATSVAFGGIPAANVVVTSDTGIDCDAPAGVPGSSVDVQVSNDNGQSTLSLGYRYHALPTLTGINPARGAALGGTRVSLSGTGFLADGAQDDLVLFGGISALDVVVSSDVLLSCTTPPGTSGTSVDVVLANQNGAATLGKGFHYNTAPVLTALAPERGPVAGGTSLTLSGSGFTSDLAGTNLVTIGGVAALDVVTVDDSTLTCATPPGAVGPALAVSVSNDNGSSTKSAAFTYYVEPVLSSVAPARGPTEGGTTVTLSGSGFLAAGAGQNLVLFGGLSASDVVELSDTQLTCTAPPGTAGAQVDVTLANQNGVATLAGAFRYHAEPVLSTLTPDNASSLGGDVTLLGSGFLADDAGENTVTFDGVAATQVVVLDDGQLTCKAPAGTPGALVDVALSNQNGSATLPAGFRYHATPTVLSVAPTRGPASGGTEVIVTGSGFKNDGAGKNLVFIGTTTVIGVAVDDTTLRLTTPSGVPGSQATVSVTNQNGNGRLVQAFTFNALPTLTGIAPATGPELGGNTVTLSGTGFSVAEAGTNTVLFGGVPATSVQVVSDSSLTCVAPPGVGATTVDVSLSNANGQATLPASYRYAPAPRLTSLSPASGSSLGGELVTLSGSAFADVSAGEALVTFGGIAAQNVAVLDDGQVQCTTPPGTSGAVVNVTLANANGSATLTGAYRYHAVPTLSGVLPARGSSVASSSVTISGTGFELDAPGPASVLFGAAAATNVVVLDDATLTCDVAPQTAGSVVDVRVTNRNGAAQLPSAFAFDAPVPVLTAVAPGSGSALGGTVVTLTGSGFADFSAGANSVRFGGAAATNVATLGDGQVTCTTPPGAVGSLVDVSITNANGTSTLTAAFTYVAPAPTLSALAPGHGPALGGNTVTLTGSGFAANAPGNNAVSFGGLTAGNVVVLGDTSLTCSVPAGSGTVDVVLSNANGTAKLVGGYRYHASPTLASVSPADGTSLGGTLVTLTGSGFLADAPGTNGVLFDTTPATSVVVVDDTHLTCRVPSGAAGTTVAVTLANANGQVVLPAAFRYHARPTLASVTPPDGSPLGGNRVTLSGTGFRTDGAVVNIVSFGGITASSITVLNDSTIQCNVPAGTPGLSVLVTVANVNGTALLSGGYRYHAKPAITAVSPTSGSDTGGTLVTLTGSGFQLDAPGTNTVTFGGIAATSVSVLGDTSLTCATPPGTDGTTVDIVVTNANGSGTLFGAFQYQAGAIPAIAGAAPNRGTLKGATSVRLTGSGFHPGVTVSFGGTPATDVVILDEQTLECRTPASETDTWVDVCVRCASGESRLPLGFLYFRPPVLGRVLPPVGPPEGGTRAVLEGEGFLANGAGLPEVRFDGIPALGVSVLDDAHVACEVPAGTVLKDAEVRLTNENGTSALVAGFRWQHELSSDLNHDGRGDLVVGSERSPLAGSSGAVHVFFGAPLPLFDRTSSQADLTALRQAADTGFGSPVASGDIDGDGIPELLVGAPLEGSVYVFTGPLEASSTPLYAREAQLVLHGLRPEESFGSALVVEDVDRDGRADVLVGATSSGLGAVYVFLSGPEGLASEPAALLVATDAADGFGQSLGVGDLDGDGWPEVVVGVPEARRSRRGLSEICGAVRVYRGGPEAFAAGEPQPAFALEGEQDGDAFGRSLVLLDLTGSGSDELVVGAPGSDRSGPDSGALFVFVGTGDGPPAGPTAIYSAQAAGDAFGRALAAGDVDGDGREDLLVGAPESGGTGRAYLFRGRAELEHRWADEADASLDAELGADGRFGAQVALVDVDGNGRDDMIVTAPTAVGTGGSAGRVYVFSSSSLERREASNDDGTLSGSLPGEKLGRSASSEN